MEEKILKIDNIELNYKYFLNEQKNHTIIILHGWGGKSESWLEMGKLLQEQGYNVYIPDLPGFGKTKIEKIYTLDDYAKLIIDFIKKLKLENIILWGHSNGGAISIKIENSRDINIKRLILNNSAGIRNDKKRSIKRKILNSLSKTIKKIIPKNKTCGKKCKVLKFFRKCFYKMIGGQDYLNAEKNPYLKQTYLNMIGTDLKKEICNINTDTLLIWGEKDTYTPVSDAMTIRKYIKKSKLIILENQHHSIHLKNPKLLLNTFIKNI